MGMPCLAMAAVVFVLGSLEGGPGIRGSQEPGARTPRVAEQESPVVKEERTVVGVGAAATQSRRGQASTPYRLPMAGNSLGRLRW
jgi:hypothetical protein